MFHIILYLKKHTYVLCVCVIKCTVTMLLLQIEVICCTNLSYDTTWSNDKHNNAAVTIAASGVADDADDGDV